jgi:molybdenum cofactor cytidylyltransferase
MFQARMGQAVKAQELKVAAVLLAAGLSRRMGERNKLLIEIGGEPLVRRTAKVYLAAGIDVHAVLGFEAEKVRAALEGLPITFVMNPHYEEGQQSSVSAGVESLAPGYDTILVALADQAALTPRDIAGLLDAFASCGGERIIVPFFQGLRGNPVAFPARFAAGMRTSGKSAVSRAFIDSNPQLIEQYEAGHERFIIDIDTPEDLASFGKKTRPGASLQDRRKTP